MGTGDIHGGSLERGRQRECVENVDFRFFRSLYLIIVGYAHSYFLAIMALAHQWTPTVGLVLYNDNDCKKVIIMKMHI